MRKIKMNALETEGYAITVELEVNSLNDYAKIFLHIFNNVRESKELLKIKNYYGSNDVTVYCEAKSKEAATKYLGSFGKIKSCEKVLVVQAEEPNYDFDKYDDVVIVLE